MYPYKRIRVDGKIKVLHRHLWEQAHGPIPPGHIVHHRNEDKHDNRIENLELLSIADHHRLHFKQIANDPKHATRRRQWGEQLGKSGKPRKFKCAHCGKPTVKIRPTAKYCGVNCNALAQYYKRVSHAQ